MNYLSDKLLIFSSNLKMFEGAYFYNININYNLNINMATCSADLQGINLLIWQPTVRPSFFLSS